MIDETVSAARKASSVLLSTGTPASAQASLSWPILRLDPAATMIAAQDSDGLEADTALDYSPRRIA